MSALNIEHAELLGQVDLFARLDRVSLARLVGFTETATYADGEIVCQQGDPADGLYVVARGCFGVYVTDVGATHESRVGVLTRGDAFGEMALLTGEARSATVRAETGDCEALRLDQEHFLTLMRRESEMALVIAGTLSRRLAQLNHAMREGEQAIARQVNAGLDRLTADRRQRVLEAGLLPNPVGEVLAALYGEHAPEVARDLARSGGGEQAPAAVQRALHDRLLLETRQGKETIAAALAGRLAEQGQSLEAARLLHAHGARAAFLAMAERAVQEGRARAATELPPLLTPLSDAEAAGHPALTELRAGYQPNVGQVSTLLQQAIASAMHPEQVEDEHDLAEAVRRLLRPRGPRDRRADDAAAIRVAPQTWPRVLRAGLGVGAALIGVAGIATGTASPRTSFILILLAAVCIWVGQLLPDFVIGLGLVAAWVFADLATPAQALAGFGSSDWMFMVGTFGLAAAVARSGLLFRIGLFLIRRLPQGLRWQSVTLLLTGVLLSMVLPANIGRAALMASLALAVADGLRLRARTPEAAALGMSAWIGASPLTFVFVNGAPFSLLAWSLLPVDSRERFDWVHWLAAAAPLGIVAAAGGLAVTFLQLRPADMPDPDPHRLAAQQSVLGPPARGEWAMLTVLALTFAGWVLAPAGGFDVGVIALAGLFGAALTGNFDRRSLQQLDWNFLLFTGVALSMGRIVTSLRLDADMAAGAGAHLQLVTGHPVAFIAVVAVASVMLRLVLPQPQAVLLLALSFIPIAPSARVDPWVAVITILAMSGVWLSPTQSTAYNTAFAASEGRLNDHRQARRVAIAYTGVLLAGIAISLPYWRWLGLL